jgi:tripeptidyl-peptidase-1
MAPEIPLTFYIHNEYSILKWIKTVLDLKHPPYVWSISYGSSESSQSGVDYIKHCTVEFMKAGAKGISLFFASGDSGACGGYSCSVNGTKFSPDFPAASPYITSVGGTNFRGSTIGEEAGWKDGGGGFSNTFDIPSWQREALWYYKSNAKLPPATLYNNAGRGYPDISALAGEKNPYCIAIRSGLFFQVAGTSAAAPVVAGIFAKLNGIRLAAGKPPLGFLNPFIYQYPEAFNDVVVGNNGFQAIKGWDPVTGWGTPNYETLSQIVEDLP